MKNRPPSGNEAASSRSPSPSLRNAAQTVGLDTLLDVPPELHEALANESRQAILARLSMDGGRVGIPELAEHLGAIGVERDEVDARASLRHVHLPKFDDCGLIEWNRTEGVVSLAVD
ncbi:DUF7344 domain-containing protein [Haladaptatus sp. NG-WS-4]